jgi:hypothetical protein
MPAVGAVGLALLVLARGALAEPVRAPIVGGTPTGDYPAVGALLAGDDPNAASTECTVTLIGCRTVVTAAHCVCPGTGASCQDPAVPSALVYFAHAGFSAIEAVAVHPDYDFPVADVAVVRLAAPVTGIAPLPVNETGTPPFGSAGTIVGFGVESAAADDSGVKRAGAVVTAPCASGVSDATSVCWDYTGPGANTCEGDSGGPLLVASAGGPVLVGTTSGGVTTTCLPTDHSYDADLFVYRDWIASVAAGDLGTTACEGVPAVGEDGIIATAFLGDLGGARPFALHSIGVAPGTTELRVGLNGSERAGRNFDLYVRGGAPPVGGAFDCSATGPNQYGFCRVSNPTPGSWYLRAERVHGDGVFQLIATTIGGDAPSCGNGMREPGEDCDGDDVGTCTSGCTAGCRCIECSTVDLDVREIGLSPRLFVQARLGDALGTYTTVDPVTAGVTIEFFDAAHTVTILVPPNDPAWVVNARRSRYRWWGEARSPVRRLELRKRSKRATAWRVEITGRNLPGTRSIDYLTLVVRVALGGRCAERRFHVE